MRGSVSLELGGARLDVETSRPNTMTPDT
jgi:hypothetical protein